MRVKYIYIYIRSSNNNSNRFSRYDGMRGYRGKTGVDNIRPWKHPPPKLQYMYHPGKIIPICTREILVHGFTSVF